MGEIADMLLDQIFDNWDDMWVSEDDADSYFTRKPCILSDEEKQQYVEKQIKKNLKSFGPIDEEA